MAREGHCRKVLEKSEISLPCSSLQESKLYVGQLCGLRSPCSIQRLTLATATDTTESREQTHPGQGTKLDRARKRQREKCAHLHSRGQKAQEKQKADCTSNSG